MKKIYSLMVLVFAGTFSFAQGHDMEVTLITPASGSTVDHTSGPISVDFTLTNNGPDAIPLGDTVWFTYASGTAGAYTAYYGFDNTPNGANGFILGAEIPSGGSTTASIDFGAPYAFDLSGWATGDQANVICLGVGGDALTQNGDAQETNPANNVDFFLLEAGAASIDELAGGMKVYPNPATDVLNVESSEEIETITIYGLDGKLVATATGVTQIQVSNLKNGVYIYEIETVSGRVVNETFMKK